MTSKYMIYLQHILQSTTSNFNKNIGLSTKNSFQERLLVKLKPNDPQKEKKSEYNIHNILQYVVYNNTKLNEKCIAFIN